MVYSGRLTNEIFLISLIHKRCTEYLDDPHFHFILIQWIYINNVYLVYNPLPYEYQL